MQTYLSLISITAVLALGTLSPGPSFVLVARNAVSFSRGHGFATTLGMGTGGFIYSMAAMLGLHVLFSTVPLIFSLLKIIGGLYLIYLAFRIICSARKPFARVIKNETVRRSLLQAYTFGLFTQLSNPKTALVFAGVFSALLPKHIPSSFYIIIPLLAFCIDAAWYSFVTFVLSSELPKNTFLRYKVVFDGTAGCILGLLGLKLIFSGK